MKTFTNSVKYRNPQTNDFETLPGFMGPGGGVHVGAKEPTNTNVNVWVTTEKENYYEIPEINDEAISSEDTWSSARINEWSLKLSHSTAQMPVTDTRYWAPMVYGNGTYVTLMNDKIAYSGDGIKWNTIPCDAFWCNIIYADNKFTALGKSTIGTIAQSTNGIDWTYSSIFSEENENITDWVNIAYGNGIYVSSAICHNNGIYSTICMTSTDGISWTNTFSSVDGFEAGWITYGNDKFVMIGVSTNQVYTSSDGLSWTLSNTSGLTTQFPTLLSYGNGKFIVGLGAGQSWLENDQKAKVCYSTDGITWSETNLTERHLNSIIYAQYKFIALSKNPNQILYSTDGITWSIANKPGTEIYQSVAFDGQRFIAIAEYGEKAIFSKDGINWTEETACFSQDNKNVTSQAYEVLNINTNYTLGEVLTGDTWIDGKPIYRFIWKGSTSLKKAQGVLCRLPAGHFDTVFTLRGMFKRTTDNNWFAIPNGYYGGTGWTVNLRTDIATDEPDGILVGFGEEYTDSNRPIIIIAEYTKQ